MSQNRSSSSNTGNRSDKFDRMIRQSMESSVGLNHSQERQSSDNGLNMMFHQSGEDSSTILDLPFEQSYQVFGNSGKPIQDINRAYGAPVDPEPDPQPLMLLGVLPQPEFSTDVQVEEPSPLLPVLDGIPNIEDSSLEPNAVNILEEDNQLLENGDSIPPPDVPMEAIPKALQVQLIQDPNEEPDLFQLRKAMTEFLFQDISMIQDPDTGEDIPNPLETQSAITMGHLITKHIMYGLIYDDDIMNSIAQIMERMNRVSESNI